MSADFDTERLSVRSWQHEDRAALGARLLEILTPQVLAALPPHFVVGKDATAADHWIEAREAEGPVLVVRENGATIGLVFLGWEGSEVHIGYLLAEEVWGQGLATELVRGLVAALSPDATAIRGGVDRGNPASAAVLRKAGFAIDPGVGPQGVDFFVFRPQLPG